MFEHYTYLLTDIGCLLFPLLFSFHRRYRFVSEWRYFWVPCVIVALLFIGWDVAFTRMGIWGFNPRYLTGLQLLGLPLEECLFFICIPYASVFTYYCVDRYLRLVAFRRAIRLASYLLSIVLAVVGLIFLHNLYTSITFLSLSVVLVAVGLRSVHYLPAFFVSFTLILIPFFLSNGLLTGMFTSEPVVWYNDAHNLGLRMGTIPVEDTFYGMLLILLNVIGFEYLRARNSTKR